MHAVLIRGPEACFTRPESTADRFTYPVITPSAAGGIIRNIYWHPNIQVDVREICVCRPIHYTRYGFTQVNKVGSLNNLMKKSMYVDSTNKNGKFDNRRLTTEVYLTDVKYIVHFEYQSNLPGKVKKAGEIFERRMRRGETYYNITLGLTHLPGCVSTPKDEDYEEVLPITRDFGTVIHDIDQHVSPAVPYTFQCRMESGRIQVPSFWDTVASSWADVDEDEGGYQWGL